MSVGLLSERCLDEALGFAISLRRIMSGEAVLDIEGGDGVAHGVGAVAGAVVRVNALNGDVVGGEEVEERVEEGESNGGGFIGEKFGEGQATVTVDGDVKLFPSGTADVIMLKVARNAMASAHNASEFLDVEVEEIAWVEVLVANDWGRMRELSEEQAMAVEDAGDGGLGELSELSELSEAGDLEGWEFEAKEGEHAGHPQRMGSFEGIFGTRTAVIETLGAFVAEAGGQLTGGAFRDPKVLGDWVDRLVDNNDPPD